MTMRASHLARIASALCERTALLGDSPRSTVDAVRTFHARAFFASMHDRGFVERDGTRRAVVCGRESA
jgi:hypothetical protein